MRGKQPAAGVKVALDTGAVVVTDSAGRFIFGDVPPGAHAVTLSGDRLTTVATSEAARGGEEARGDLRGRSPGGEGERRGRRRPRDRRHRAAPREAGRLDRGRRRAGAQGPGTQGDVLKVVENLPGVARAAVGSGALVVWGAAPAGHARLRRRRPRPAALPRRRVPLGRAVGHGSGRRARPGRLRRRLRPRPRGPGHRRAPSARRARASTAASAPTRSTPSASVRANVTDQSPRRRRGPQELARLGPLRRHSRERRRSRPHPALLGRAGARRLRSRASTRPSRSAASSRPTARRAGREPRPVAHDARRPPASTSAASTPATSGTLTDGGDVDVVAVVGHDSSSLDQPVRRDAHRACATTRTSSACARAGAGRSPRPRVGGVGPRRRGPRLEHLTASGRSASPPREGDVYVFGQPPRVRSTPTPGRPSSRSVAPYVEGDIASFGDALHVVPASASSPTSSPPPRACRRWATPVGRISPARTGDRAARLASATPSRRELRVKAAYGVYHQPPAGEDLSAVFGTPKLGLSDAEHSSAGPRPSSPARSTSRPRLLHRRRDLVVAQPVASPVRSRRRSCRRASAAPTGRSFSFASSRSGRFFGWVSYTLMRSERQDHPGLDWRLFDYDQTHVFTALGSFDLGRGLRGRRPLPLRDRLPPYARHRQPTTTRCTDVVRARSSAPTTRSASRPSIALDARVSKHFKRRQDAGRGLPGRAERHRSLQPRGDRVRPDLLEARATSRAAHPAGRRGEVVVVTRALVMGLLLVARACEPEPRPAHLRRQRRLACLRCGPSRPRRRRGRMVKLSALYVSPDGGASRGPFDWAFCDDRNPLANLGPVSPACAEASGSVFVELGTGATQRGVVPTEACRQFGPDVPPAQTGESPGRPVDPDSTGGYYQPVRLVAGDQIAVGLVRITCDVPGATPDQLTALAAQRPPQHQPADRHGVGPTLGRSWSPGAVSTRSRRRSASTSRRPGPTATGRRRAAPGRRATRCSMRRRTRWSMPASRCACRGSPRRGRSIATGRGAARPTRRRTPTTAGPLPAAPGQVWIWVVLRDDRGGVGWRSYALDVE